MPDYKPIEKIIIKCKNCGQKLRIPTLSKNILFLACPACKSEFTFDLIKFKNRMMIKKQAIKIGIVIFLCINIAFPILAAYRLNKYLIPVNSEYQKKIEGQKIAFLEELKELEKNYEVDISSINIEELRNNAKNHYAKIWDERNNYNSSYAMTQREIMQLEMLELSKDSTKDIDDIVTSIAIKAAPKNSDVESYTTREGTFLNIDFHMSDLTRGEEGTSTKHSTIESLKNESLRLISKVTNDVYNFCRDLELEAITIGCKHEVVTSYPDGTRAGKSDSLLFKVKLDRQDIKELKHNPFLDTYSVTQYLQVIEDNFSNLRIITGT